MDQDHLATHLSNLERDDRYRVDRVLKQSEYETTQVVYFVGDNGAEQGPYIRKYLSSSRRLGSAYEALHEAWRSGRRFRHIPMIFDCFRLGEDLVVVMEYVMGETLQDVVCRVGPSFALAADLFPCVCNAIIELHETLSVPLIHRDLKPSNIMLTQDTLTLIDFGISRLYNEGAEQDTCHFGTRLYAPPEQFGFGQTDVRSDVYTLGMLLYFCVTAEVPAARARDTGFHDSRIPGRLREVLVKATDLDPKKRYPSVRKMREDFVRAATRMRLAPRQQPHMRHIQQPLTQRSPAQQPIAQSLRQPLAQQPPLRQPPAQQPAQQTVPQSIGSATASYAVTSAPDAITTGSAAVTAATDVASSSRKPTMLSRIPAPIGVAWNAVILLALLLLLIACFDLTMNPAPDYVHVPLYGRALMYGSALFLVFGPIAFLALDKRMFRQVFPAVARLSFPKQLIISLTMFVIGFFAVLVTVGIWG